MEREWTKPSSLVLIAGILVVLNILGMNWFLRMDLTDDQVYSLSNYSIDLVESLEDPITVTAYFAQDLPAPYSSTRRFVKDKLAEYRAYGGEYQVSQRMGSWRVSSPSGSGSTAIDSAQARRWMDRFDGLRATGILPDVNAADLRAKATHTIAITAAGGQTTELYLQKSENQVQTVTGASDTVYELPAWRLNRLVPSRESLVSGGGRAPSPRIRTAPG